VTVEAVTDLHEVATVYNLRVAEYHTYFVGSRAWGFSVWAHNAEYEVVRLRYSSYVVVNREGVIVRTVNSRVQAERLAAQFNEAAAAGRVVPTGELHHPISVPIARALDQHPTLRVLADRRREFTTRALDASSHGWDRFHIDLDNQVIAWINDPRHLSATPEEFLAWLRSLYNTPELRVRFPEGF
jgi:hypothetical protein